MKYIDNGSSFTVQVSAIEVSDFAAKWPCSGLRNRGLWFMFSKRSGDLEDMSPTGNGDELALKALSDDAQAFGEHVMRHRS